MPAEAKPVAPEDRVGAALVVGAGVGGIQAALDLADSGIKVYLLDRGPAIGGAMAQLDKTFPTNDCSLCILSPKLVEAGRHRNIELLTLSELKGLEGAPGRFKAKVLRKARSVDMEKCTGCGICSKECLVHNRIEVREQAESEPDERVAKIVARYDGDAGMLIPMMQDIQEEFGYLPGEMLTDLSGCLGVPLPQIYGAATFYSSFRLQPKGEHT
ncbi:MAG: NADH-quinone oxidoreductase subunit NuoE family protein, partial [Planctomycetota bacterium]